MPTKYVKATKKGASKSGIAIKLKNMRRTICYTKNNPCDCPTLSVFINATNNDSVCYVSCLKAIV